MVCTYQWRHAMYQRLSGSKKLCVPIRNSPFAILTLSRLQAALVQTAWPLAACSAAISNACEKRQ
jgi:hypothetical protein